MLLTRPISGELSGRKMVLRTAHRFFSEKADVTVFFIEDGKSKRFCRADSSFVSLSRPSFYQLIYNFFCYFILGGWSLNEVLFFSKENARTIASFTLENFDYIYIDSIRMAPYVSHSKVIGCKCVIDFDDIYSLRYERLSRSYSSEIDALGFYKSIFPAFFMRIVNFFMRSLLALESKRVSKREVYYSGLFNKRVIVSSIEASIMHDKTKLKFVDIAMTVPDYKAKWLSPVRTQHSTIDAVNVCLIGNFDYYPNQQSVKYIVDCILPVFAANHVKISVCFIGKVSEEFSKKYTSSNVRFMGFVDDLSTSVSDFDCLVSPILSGTGIKTKIVEAFSLGIPVVTNEKGIEGMTVKDGEQVLLAEKPEDYFDVIMQLTCATKLQEDISREAYQYYLNNFSYDVIKEKWNCLLKEEEA